MKKFVLPLIAAAFLGGCADGAGPESSESSSVTIKFGVAGSTASAPSAAMFSVAGGQAAHPGHIEGLNGDVLDITKIWLIIEEFELEPVEHHCDDGLGGEEHCPKFEERFFFIDLPLDGNFTTVTTGEIPVGSYDELEIEVDNVHVHDDDSDEDAALIRELFDVIIPAAGFTDWPEDASMVVIGTFTPAVGDLEDFRTFFEAEIEIEVEFDDDEPLVVDGSDSSILVTLMLHRWFESGDGLLNLADSKFQDLDDLVEFELEIEDGFEVEIEVHHHN